MDNTDETIKKRFEQIQEIEDDIITTQDKTASTTAGSTRIFITPEKQPLPIHRQARGLMKTAGALVSRDTEPEHSLFDAPRFHAEINPYKEVLSRNTAITAQLLIKEWQKNKDANGIYKITNLTAIAEQLNIFPQELKLYLIYLGGYQRPIVKLNIIKGEKGKKDKRILSIYHDKLFFIKFNILLKDGETENTFNDDHKIGTNYCSFIKGRDITSVEIAPSTSFMDELIGRGLGNILVDDGFTAFSLELKSDLAYKLLCYSASNKPKWKIGFTKLIRKDALNIEKQVKKQGKPRELKRIQEAGKELLDKGHYTEFNYNPETDTFSWVYSNKIIKHKELLPIKVKSEETGQTGQ